MSLTDPAAGRPLFVARVTLVELVSAITRRGRRGDLAAAHPRARGGALDRVDAAGRAALAEKHALRGYDAVQLAAALRVNDAYVAAGHPATVTLVSADIDLNAASAAEGLPVEDPNTH